MLCICVSDTIVESTTRKTADGILYCFITLRT